MLVNSTIKILLDTPAVAKLLEGDPRIEVELKAIAAEGVAEQIKVKLTKDVINGAVDSAVKRAMSEYLTEVGWAGGFSLTAKAQQAIDLAVTKVAEKHMGRTRTEIEAMVKKVVDDGAIQREFDGAMARYVRQLDAKLDAKLDELVNKAVQVRLGAVLKAVSG